MTDTTPVLQAFEKDQTKVNFTINQLGRRLGGLSGNTIRYDIAQSLTEAQTAQARSNMYAAPFDALAYNGMQINGSMEVSQELGTTARIGGGYVADVWTIAGAGTYALSSAQVVDAPPGLSNSVKISVTTAEASLGSGDFAIMFQNIEGFRTSRLAFGAASAQSISIGFWSKTHRTGMYSGSIRNAGLSRSYVFTFTQNVTDTWQYNTATIPGDVTGTWIGNTNGVGLIITFTIAAGSTFQTAPNAWVAGNFSSATGTTNGVAALTDTFQITGVVVLPGIEAPSAARSPLIMRPFPQELEICRRYYQQVYGNARFAAAGAAQVMENGVYFAPWMRATPTITTGSPAATGNLAATYPQVSSSLMSGCRFIIVSNAAGDTFALTVAVIADARL